MKKTIWILLTIVVLLSTLMNIKNQFNTLESAKTKNEELKLKLEQMNVLKNNLIKKAEYATSSAFANSQRIELLGLGIDNDYWLDIKENSDKPEEIIRQVYETEKKSNFRKWIGLFTQ
jgi:predicted transcriptional regulator